MMIHALENEVHGTFNATGPSIPLTMEEFVYGVKATSSSEVTWTWVDDYEFLMENGFFFAVPWIVPVGDNLGSQCIDIDRAKAAGLKFRPIAVTAVETLEWYNSLTEEERSNPPMVLTPEGEAELLEKWTARNR